MYIYDYFVKRNLQATAKAFQAEGKVSSDPVGTPLEQSQCGFLTWFGFCAGIVAKFLSLTFL